MTRETCDAVRWPSFFLTSFNRGRGARASRAPLDPLLIMCQSTLRQGTKITQKGGSLDLGYNTVSYSVLFTDNKIIFMITII